jgi:hypothetical protein
LKSWEVKLTSSSANADDVGKRTSEHKLPATEENTSLLAARQATPLRLPIEVLAFEDPGKTWKAWELKSAPKVDTARRKARRLGIKVDMSEVYFVYHFAMATASRERDVCAKFDDVKR